MEKGTGVIVDVFAGICGFTTIIDVRNQGGYTAQLGLETECPNLKKVADRLGEAPLNVMNELFKKGESQVFKVCGETIPHVSCPVPAAILKALEVGVGLALPSDPTITFRKELSLH